MTHMVTLSAEQFREAPSLFLFRLFVFTLQNKLHIYRSGWERRISVQRSASPHAVIFSVWDAVEDVTRTRLSVHGGNHQWEYSDA